MDLLGPLCARGGSPGPFGWDPGCDPEPALHPWRQLERATFLRYFRNSLLAAGWSSGLLCVLVERLQLGVLTASHTRILGSQPDRHAELIFLSWLQSLQRPGDDEDTHFLVTCFVSWSPCWFCAEQVGAFLAAHGNMRLRILAARLPWDLSHQEGLRQLHQQGVLVDVMSLKDFHWCWDLFVRHAGASFQPWWGLSRNHGLLLGKLQDILGSQMSIDTFQKNFDNNMPVRQTVLCYEVDGAEGLVPRSQRTGFLMNLGRNMGEPVHAELLLLERIRAWALEPTQPCRITVYISWSPCVMCAQNLVDFLRQHPGVELNIRAARIYTLDFYQQGLRNLRAAGANISIMTSADFEYCWRTFVQNEGHAFSPPGHLDNISNRLAAELKNIFQRQDD